MSFTSVFGAMVMVPMSSFELLQLSIICIYINNRYPYIISYHIRQYVLDKTLNCLDRGGRCDVAGYSAHLLPWMLRPISINIWFSLPQAKGYCKLLHLGVFPYRMASS